MDAGDAPGVSPLADHLKSAAATGLIDASARVLIALSGGPDSCALLVAFSELADLGVLPRPIGAAHYHHGLRGVDADIDAAFSAALCARLGLPCVIGIGVASPGPGESPNAAARRARYAFLTEAASDFDADTIATAHTRDDQAETVLGRVLRGAAIDGLAGIPAQRILGRGLTIVRPLLTATRAEIEAYCADHGIAPRIDPSNSKDRYTRSRLRKRLPELAREFNPRLPEALVRLAEHARRDGDLLGQMAERLWGEVVQNGDGGESGATGILRRDGFALTPGSSPNPGRGGRGEPDVAFRASETAQDQTTPAQDAVGGRLPLLPLSQDWERGPGGEGEPSSPKPHPPSPAPLTLHLPPLRAAHAALRGRVLIRAIRAALGDADVSAEQAATLSSVEAVEELVMRGGPGMIDLPGSLRVTVAGEVLSFAVIKPTDGNPAKYEVALSLPGSVAVAAIGLRLTASYLQASSIPLAHTRRSPTIEMAYNGAQETTPFVLRSARPGDRIAPLGMGGNSRLVRDLLREAGVAAGDRGVSPLVQRADTGEIVWVVGVAQAESTRIRDPAMQRIVRLHAEWEFGE